MTTGRERSLAIDWLRGVVMVLMALDHVRYFFSDVPFAPEDETRTWPALFFTRWITHYCAPLFFLLAGCAASISSLRRTPAEQTNYLLSRGLWLVILELTVMGFAWSFTPGYSFAGVIWALGWSMILLAGVWRLPAIVNGVIALAIIALHDLLATIDSAVFATPVRIAWHFLHVPGPMTLPGGGRYRVLFPIAPWFAVMLLGFVLGRLWMNEERRQKVLLACGIAGTALFIVLRLTNMYGNPMPFRPANSWPMTIVAFLNVEKYPPSLQYQLMTLGPSLIILAMADRWLRNPGRINGALVTFGRVPLFYYICHLYLIHALAVASTRVNLALVWLIWGVVVALLYVPSRWFAALKAARQDWWLRYV